MTGLHSIQVQLKSKHT